MPPRAGSVALATGLLLWLGPCLAALKDIDKGKAGGAQSFKLGDTVNPCTLHPAPCTLHHQPLTSLNPES